MKFCKDCRFCTHTTSTILSPVCGASRNINLVTGELDPHACFIMRSDGMDCGQEGRLFEPIESNILAFSGDAREAEA